MSSLLPISVSISLCLYSFRVSPVASSHSPYSPIESAFTAFGQFFRGMADGFIREPLAAPSRHRTPSIAWRGLNRYRQAAEFANTPHVLKCEALRLRYAWDAPGVVAESDGCDRAVTEQDYVDWARTYNLSAPQYELEASLKTATVNYGPWTDKQRQQVMEFFFPRDYRVRRAEQPLRAGEQRRATSMKVRLIFI